MRITIELDRPTWLRRPRKAITLLLATALVLLVPLGAHASNRFSDVPDSSFFHNSINAIAGAGITLGCGATNYCPSAFVTREQMAAFLHRGLGRVAVGDTTQTAVNSLSEATVSSLTIKAGEAAGGTVKVKLDAALVVFPASGCPCNVSFFIEWIDGLTPISSSYRSFVPVPGAGGTSGAVNWVLGVPTGETHTFRVRAQVYAGTGSVQAAATFSAVTEAFGSQGTSAP